MGAPHPDLELARRAAGGDAAAWREILARSGPHLFALLCYQTGHREEALDLLQETYLQAFRKLGHYRGEGPLEAWLRAIAVRKALDWKRGILRKLGRTVLLPAERLESMAGPAAPPERTTEAERRELHRALAALLPSQRAVFLLREWEELSFAEVARILGCREGTARVRYVRAREKLRRLLGAPSRGQAAGERPGEVSSPQPGGRIP